MKVTLEKGETLDVALVENNQIVGTLSLVLRGVDGGSAGAAGMRRGRVGRPPKAASAASAGESDAPRRGARKGRKRNISPEARERMRQAQLRRWNKFRKDKSK